LAVGGIVRIEDGIERGNWVAILSLKGELVAIGKSLMDSKDMLKKRGLAVKTDRVFMKKDTGKINSVSLFIYTKQAN